MPFHEELADRVRRAIGPDEEVTEKKMFGGLAFFRGGRMFCGIVKDELMVRVGPDRYDEALEKRHVRPMDFTGRPMKGYVFVESPGCRSDKTVRAWVELGAAFVATLSERPHVGRQKRPGNRSARQSKR